MTYHYNDRRAGKQAALKPSRAQRCQFEKLAARIDNLTQAYARFFERFPHRKHRVRLAARAEIEQTELMGKDMSLPPGKQHYIAVRNLTPGMRLRLAVIGPRDADPELYGEEGARAIFTINETEEVRKIEATLLADVSK